MPQSSPSSPPRTRHPATGVDSVTPLMALRADRRANRGNPRGQLAVIGFRLAQAAREGLPRPLAKAVELAYAVVWLALLGIELPPGVCAGPGLRIFHTVGIVVNPASTLGSNCTLRQSSTLGALPGPGGEHDAAPVLGDAVELGASVLIIGPITVGDGATVGAGSVVVADVPAGATVVGNPARILS